MPISLESDPQAERTRAAVEVRGPGGTVPRFNANRRRERRHTESVDRDAVLVRDRKLLVVFVAEFNRGIEVVRSGRLGTCQFCCSSRCDANTAAILFDTTRDQSHQRLENNSRR
jgi:hypothetical protein